MPFSTLSDNEFSGRQEELTLLFNKVLQADAGAGAGIVLSGSRGVGKTELLKQLFGLLFWKQDHVAPFYYVANPALLSAETFSKTYLMQFLYQRIAFEKKEQSLFWRDGTSLADLSMLLEDRDAAWAKEILQQYEQNSSDPIGALRIALAAPYRSALLSGMPVAVLIDEFQRLQGLSIQGAEDPHLVSLFEKPFSLGKALHVITGNAAELREMPVTNSLERFSLAPLDLADAASRAQAILRAHNLDTEMPPLLIRHLGGNPFYLECIGKALALKKDPGNKEFWGVYIKEITEGGLALYWSSVLKGFFQDLGKRKHAIAVSYKIYHAKEPFSCSRIAATFSMTENQAETLAHTLYRAGIIQGEFGVFRPVEDNVLHDIIDCLYLKEVLAKSAHDLERELMERLLPEKTGVSRFDLTLPMTKEAELVAAQCIDQIGKNLHLNQDITGQLQIAVIEACINAMEHSRGAERKVYVSIVADEGRLEVSIESAGQEFIVQETGEPFVGREAAKTGGRGWGIKLMKRFADDVKFEKTTRGIKTVLIKHLDKAAREQKEDAITNE